MNTMLLEDEVGEAIYGEEALAWVLAQGQDPAATGPAEILEVSQICGESVDVRYFQMGQSVRVGTDTVFRLQFAGLSVGEIPRSLRPISWLAPGLATVEEGWKHPFQVPAEMLPVSDHPIFQAREKGWVARVSPHWGGFVERDGQRRSFETLGIRADADGLYSIPLPADGLLALDLGGPIFVARQVPRSRAVKLEPMQTDHSMVAMAGFFAFLVAMLGGSVAMAPAPVRSTNEFETEAVILALQKPENKPEASPAAAKDPVGKAGKPDATKQQAKGKMTREQRDREAADHAGLLAALNSDSDLSDALSSTGLASGISNGIGGLIGAKGTQIGAGGFGNRGGGIGGGGTADSIGGLSTHGGGHGTNGGDFSLTSRGDPAPIAIPGEIIVMGALDRSLIDAVIKRNLTAIRYCYQRELTRAPNLSGKVKVRFVIAADGSVSSATTASSTLNNPSAEACINGRIQRMGFPQPKGGGIVVVSYPFLFSSN